MTFILTNDDGIDAPGLAALEQAVMSLAEERLIVAPRHPMSECSHQVTTKAHIHVEPRGPNRYAVAGTPADCTRVALLHLLPARGSTVSPGTVRVFSGINSGGNLGADVYVSGTVAAAREAAFFGIPAVAFSQYQRGEITTWPRTAHWARRVLAELDNHPWQAGTFWNVNFPFLPVEAPEPRIVFCPRSRRPLPVKYEAEGDRLSYVQGLYHTRAHEADSDVAVCFSGHIAVTLVSI